MSEVAIVTVSEKGQIVLPKRIRDLLKIVEGSRLFVEEKAGKITIQKMESFAADENVSNYWLSRKSFSKIWDTPQEDDAWKKL